MHGIYQLAHDAFIKQSNLSKHGSYVPYDAGLVFGTDSEHLKGMNISKVMPLEGPLSGLLLSKSQQEVSSVCFVQILACHVEPMLIVYHCHVH